MAIISNSTTELQNLGTIEVIHEQTDPPLISDTPSTSSLYHLVWWLYFIGIKWHDNPLIAQVCVISNTTAEEEFAIPKFLYDTQSQEFWLSALECCLISWKVSQEKSTDSRPSQRKQNSAKSSCVSKNWLIQWLLRMETNKKGSQRPLYYEAL